MWQGWASRAAGAPDHEWIELSRILTTGMPKISYFPDPRFSRLLSMPGDPLNLTEMQMAVHVGTHIDAPCHFIADGPEHRRRPLRPVARPRRRLVARRDRSPTT